MRVHSAPTQAISAFATARSVLKTRPALPPLDVAQRYTPEEAAAYLRSSRWSVFQDLREGRLASIREGRRVWIPGSEIARRSRLVETAA